jgi:glycosyltransferase involved in cell wall biosynthesis
VSASLPSRLAILTPSFGRGGSEEYVIALARWALARGHAVTVGLPDHPGVDSVRRDLLASGVSVDTIDADPEPLFSEELFQRIRRQALQFVTDGRFDRLLIILPTLAWGGSLIDAAAHADIPTAILYQLVNAVHPFTPFERAYYTWARRQRQIWITVSAQNRDLVCESLGWDADAIEVVPNALLRPLTVPSAAERVLAAANVRREIGAADEARLIVTVGRLHEQKGIDRLIEAASLLVAHHPALHVVWIGDGEARPRATTMIAERQLADRVHLLGHRPNVTQYLRAADLFVLPSRWEGWPFAALEALGMAVPVVLSDIGPHRELIRDGCDGVLTPVEDATGLARGIARVLKNAGLHARLRAAGPRRAASFAPGSSFERLFDLLESTVSPAGARRARWPRTEHDGRTERVAIYGTGAGGRRAYAEQLPGVEVVAFLDAHPRQPDLLGVPIVAPHTVCELGVDRVVVASAVHATAMVETLRGAGYPAGQIEIFSRLRLDEPRARET